MTPKRFLLLGYFIIINLFLMNPLTAQSDFEGSIKMEISSENEKSVMNYFKKDNSTRIEVTGEQSGVMILKPDKTIMIMPANKMYMEWEGSIMDLAKKYSGEENSEEKLKDLYDEIEQYKTGETREIQGYNCEKYFITDEMSETEIWATGELGKFLFMMDPESDDSWLADIANKNFFPMLVISKDMKSGETDRLEVTEVERKNLSSDLFDAPADYQKMTMPGMME
jgi:hypothetical protein